MVYKGYTIYNDSEVTPEWVKEKIDENGKGAFWVTYNVTTKAEISEALQDGKICILKETNPAGAVNYASLYFKGVSESFIFISPLNESGLYDIYKVDIDGTWSKEQKNTLPNASILDDSKILTVENGVAVWKYPALNRFGIEGPLQFKKDTEEETIIGFLNGSEKAGKALMIDNDGELKYLTPFDKCLIGAQSPLTIEERENAVIIKLDSTCNVTKYFEIDSNDHRTWTYNDLIYATNSNINPIIRKERGINDWFYYRLTRIWSLIEDGEEHFKMQFVTVDVKTLNSSQTLFGAIYVRDDDILTHDNSHF